MTPTDDNLNDIIAKFWSLPLADRRAILSKLDQSAHTLLKQHQPQAPAAEPAEKGPGIEDVRNNLSTWLSTALDASCTGEKTDREQLVLSALQSASDTIQSNPADYARSARRLLKRPAGWRSVK